MWKLYLQPERWSDAELIAAVESFDAAAYAELQQRHEKAARSFAALLSADPADVDAIVAGTFTQLRGVIESAAGPKVALRPYLYTAVRWAAHDRLGGSQDSRGSAAARPSALAPDTVVLPADTSALAPDPAVLPAGAEVLPADSPKPAADAAAPPANAAELPPDATLGSGKVTGAAAAQTAAGGAAGKPARDLGEPLFTDPDIADLVRSPLYRAFRSLPERFRAAAWHSDIEQVPPELTATILGLTLDEAGELAAEARRRLRQACLHQHLSDITRGDCAAALEALADGADSVVSGPGEPTAQQHLAGCADCQAAVAEVADLGESLRSVVAPVFLGAVAAAYLSAARAEAADESPAEAGLATAGLGVGGLGVGGLRWTGQEPSRARRRRRPSGILIGAGAMLGVLALTGLALAAVSNAASGHTPSIVQSPRAAAAVPANPAGAVPPVFPAPTLSPTPASQTPASPDATATPKASPTTPVPTTPAPTPVPTTPTPTPVPTTTGPTPTPTFCPPPCVPLLNRCHCPPPPLN